MRCTPGEEIQGFSIGYLQNYSSHRKLMLGRGILRLAPKARRRTALALLSAFKRGTKVLRATSPWFRIIGVAGNGCARMNERGGSVRLIQPAAREAPFAALARCVCATAYSGSRLSASPIAGWRVWPCQASAPAYGAKRAETDRSAFWTFSAGAFSLRAAKAWLDDADDAISDLILRSKTSSTEPSYLSAHRCVPVSASTSCAVYRAGAAAPEFVARCGFKLSRPFKSSSNRRARAAQCSSGFARQDRRTHLGPCREPGDRRPPIDRCAGLANGLKPRGDIDGIAQARSRP
jgi:hypothetical protein